jgi:hypothetical protein
LHVGDTNQSTQSIGGIGGTSGMDMLRRYCVIAPCETRYRQSRLSGQESGRGFLKRLRASGRAPAGGCDQKSICDLALALDKLGYRREAANGLYNLVRNCGAPLSALNQSVNIYLKLTDYGKAVEVANEFVRREPTNHDAHYLRGVALQEPGISSQRWSTTPTPSGSSGRTRRAFRAVFSSAWPRSMQRSTGCEATAPINMWVSLDTASRDTSRNQKIISDHEARGNCAASTEFQKESYPLRRSKAP